MGYGTNVRVYLSDNRTIEPGIKTALGADIGATFRSPTGDWRDREPNFTGWWPGTQTLTFRGIFYLESQSALQTMVERHLPGAMLFWEPESPASIRELKVVTGGSADQRRALLTARLCQQFEDKLQRAIAGDESELSELWLRVK